MTLEELKYINATDFLKWDGIGVGLFEFTREKLHSYGWDFGIYTHSYYIEHREEIRNKNNAVAYQQVGWTGSRDALAKDILVAYCANHDMIAEEARIDDIIRISLKTASRFIRELAR